MELLNKYLCLDFDGTVCTHEYPGIGRCIGAEPVLKRIVEAGCHLILWTMRSGAQLDEAVQWFKARDIPLFGVQRNPTQDAWTTSPKAYGHYYLDDAAIGCPLCPGLKGERSYVDWKKVEDLLFPAAEVKAKSTATGSERNDHE